MKRTQIVKTSSSGEHELNDEFCAKLCKSIDFMVATDDKSKDYQSHQDVYSE